jgi:hypothetical protein
MRTQQLIGELHISRVRKLTIEKLVQAEQATQS